MIVVIVLGERMKIQWRSHRSISIAQSRSNGKLRASAENTTTFSKMPVEKQLLVFRKIPIVNLTLEKATKYMFQYNPI